MNMVSALSWSVEWLEGAPPILGLVGRWTALLALAWGVHLALTGCNPRWRVALWRSVVVGLGAIPILLAAPPVVTWRVARVESARKPVRVADKRDRSPASTFAPAVRPSPAVAPRPIAPVTSALHSPRIDRRVGVATSPPNRLPERVVARPRSAVETGSSREAAMNEVPSRVGWPATFGTRLLTAWLAGVVLLAVRLVLGAWRLSRVVRRGQEAPEEVIAESRAFAARLGVARSIRVVCSAEVPTPCLAGLGRPVLLLPDQACRDSERADWPAILAHELAHARGHDLAWNGVWHLATLLLWFHPLIWRARAAHAAACDAVCDAVAADVLGDVTLYVRSLARLALRVAGPPPALGLTMARTSDVRRRIQALQQKVFSHALPRRLTMPALLAFGVFVVLIGGLGLAPADEVEERKPEAPPLERQVKTTPAKRSRIVVRIVAAKTGEPLEGVSISYQGTFNNTRQKGSIETGKDGTGAVEWPDGATVNSLTLKVMKSKYVGAYLSWDDEKHPVTIPESKELRLESGVTMGGIVRNEAGRPVAGATVEITAPVTESEQANSVFELGKTKTDEQGRWHLDEAPENLGAVFMHVSHPDFRRKAGSHAEGRENLVILTKGLTVRGRVLNSAGEPVKGARAVLGNDAWSTGSVRATTDERGEFVLKNCNPGPTAVTVQADGFAPEVHEIQVARDGETSTPGFRLEPGSMLRGKVVDREGRPVAGATWAADTWRGRQSIEARGETDAEGRFLWKDAPRDAVQFDIFEDGYMRERRLPLVASAAEQVVTLKPALVVSGRVTDATTGAPIAQFHVIQGRQQFTGPQQTLWSTSEAAEATGGAYSTRFEFPMRAHFVRIEAPGYKTADSRPFRSDEGAQAQDFALERVEGLSGVVLLPDGKPAEGVVVVVATREQHVSMNGGAFDRDSNVSKATTGPDGRFFLPAQDDRFLLIAASDAGFADASPDEFAKGGKLVLQPWGRIEGEVRIGRNPGANRPVSFQPRRPDRGGGLFVFSYGYSSGTDSRGRFVLEKVIPGPGSLSHDVVTEFAGSQQVMPCWNRTIEVVPGSTCRVVLGGEGRPVVGRVILDGKPEEPVDWVRNEPAVVAVPRDQYGRSPDNWSRYAANLDKDGRFRIDDVPPGRYELTIPVNTPPDPTRCGSGAKIGQVQVAVTVPEGSIDDPVNVGDVTAKLLPTLKAGDLAPDFVAQTLDGKRFRLGDQQGKLVLLDFWATWCAPCLAEMPAMKELNATFAGDPRFKLVGLACEEGIEAPAQYAKEHRMDWAQGLAGNMSGGIAASNFVRAIPATVLIGPDGRVLARNLRGAALKEAIHAALKNDALFAKAKSSTRPPRFPVTRYEAETQEKNEGVNPPSPPAVVVLDDCDADFREARPHRDALRFVADTGRELHALNEFNTCQTTATHEVALDPTRGRVYICELVAHRVTALDIRGRKLWRVDGIEADALAVDPRTGNLWCSGGSDLRNGETVVLDPEGNEVASFPVRGIDLAYDPVTDGFWLVGYGITKLSREGKVLFHKPHEGWACIAVAVNDKDGRVWIVERAHPDVAKSVNRLWHLDANGEVLQSKRLDKRAPFAVACDSRTGTAWVVNLRSELLGFTRDGRELSPLTIAAMAVAVSPTNGQIWVTTKTEILKIDETGAILGRTPLGANSEQSWLAAF